MAGRFAPSPTGPLHLGSLATALASHAMARRRGAAWLLRMEDLDPPREPPGADTRIRQQLHAHGLIWDRWQGDGADGDGVMVQSRRHAAYQLALNRLLAAGQAFACQCSRRQLQQDLDDGLTQRLPGGEIRYSGRCRDLGLKAEPGRSIRIRSPEGGDDFVLWRADGFWAYHLAVVVDDAEQAIDHIVRGSDLIDALPRHRLLQQLLGLPSPPVWHVPVICNANGEKLSKQTLAAAVSEDQVETNLSLAWDHLRNSGFLQMLEPL